MALPACSDPLPRIRHGAATAPVPQLDGRFRALLGEIAWASLPPAVRARFARKAMGTHAIVYVGEVCECRTSRAGRWLAHACRLIGAPLPLWTDTGVAATVCVTEDARGGGQVWTRAYARRGGFPQIVHSAKRFAGPTGLEEHLGLGFGIALTAHVAGEALLFESDHYFWRAGRIRLRLPRWAAPGRLTIAHVDLDHGRFAFTLALDHPLVGPLVHQTCLFTEARVAA